ncbi:arginase [Arenibacter algicola]|uniref:arginase n=1 Tax=Arenibacter algicola TaxID=616991 RepID=UPI001C06EB5C|nr:arginase [Arenibacter algicola]MBU2904325.1 arginase [Arenibacter algicola]
MKKNLRIIKNRSDIGAGTRGADMGIDAMEIAAINAENDFFNRASLVEVKTHNESIYNMVKNSFAKRISFVVEQCNRVSNTVKETLLKDEFPLVLSGDHSSALGTISGIKAVNPEGRLGVVWIDAHADLNTPYTSPSGNIHGMPLAAAMQEDNTVMQSNDPDEETIKSWAELKNIGTNMPKFFPEDLIYFGVRDTEEAEDNLILRKGIKNYTVPEVRFRGLENCMEEAIDKLGHCDIIYITFDVDSLDCDFVSRGTGTPVPFGFSPEEAKSLISGFLKTDKVICIEFTEVNPLLDNKGNRMAETAFDILSYCFG